MHELYNHQRSPIHQSEARVKIIFTLAFLLFLNLLPYNAWAAFFLFLTISLSLALLSRLGIAFLLRRSLLALPFMLAAVPLVFTGPPPHIPIQLWPGFQIVYSPQGLARFTGIAVKSWISVQIAVLLAATTAFPDLLAALRQLRLPAVFVAVIGLMGRYLYVIHDEAERMLRARLSRSASLLGTHRSSGSLFWRARMTGGMAGSLFLRSLERSERVYTAMLSRGYTGDLPVSEAVPLTARERNIIVFSTLFLALLWLLGLLVR